MQEETTGQDTTPPTITATLSQPPNANGWHNSDVTVSFTCSDAESGVAFCPEPVLVTTEGAEQVVTGTATDNAGNSAVASVTVKLDKSPPFIAPQLTPEANFAGWNNTDVTVSFQAFDDLSGVATVTEPILITTETDSQSVQGTATDLAGNTANTSATVRLDKTPPAIVIASPAEGAILLSSPVTVSGSLTDSLSGVTEAACNGVSASLGNGNFSCTLSLSTPGSNIITVQALDAAGNLAEATRTIEYTPDTTEPVLTLVSPTSPLLLNQDAPEFSFSYSDDLAGINPSSFAASIDEQPLVCQADASTATCTTSGLASGLHTLQAQVSDLLGNQATLTFQFTVSFSLDISIDQPAAGLTLNHHLILVSGTVSALATSVLINGFEAAVSGGSFSLPSFALHEGLNTITAVAYDEAGHVGMDSVRVNIDRTPPTLQILSPPDGSVLAAPSVNVMGVINDLGLGTVNNTQASVTVNGVVAQVANRGFLAYDIPLTPGSNTITATATDRAGNSRTASISVYYDQTAYQTGLQKVSGDEQTATIFTELPQPLLVRLLDSNSQPVSGAKVAFRVVRGNGSLTGSVRALIAETDASGHAETLFTLGSRAGAGVNQVRATAENVLGEQVFSAIALTGPPASIYTTSLNDQRGVVGQPLTRDLVAIVSDAGQNPVQGVPVTFQVIEGDGKVNGAPLAVVQTDSTGMASVVHTLGPFEGLSNNIVEAGFEGLLNEKAVFTASAFVQGDPDQTRFTGVVLDNQGNPVEDVTVSIKDVGPSDVTDEHGQFELFGVPVGRAFLVVDAGSIPFERGIWASLEWEVTNIAGINNSLPRPIYILPLDMQNSKTVGGSEDVTINLPQTPGLAMTVLSGSAIFPGGSPTGIASITTVHADKIPMPPGAGMQPRVIVSIQPAGAHFDPPAPVTFPNTDGLLPGTVTEMFSFDHDIGDWVSIGTGTVSEDGLVIRSDPGIGIVKACWHCASRQVETGQNAALHLEIKISKNNTCP